MREEDQLYISPYVRNARCNTALIDYINLSDYDNVFSYIIDGTLDYITNGMHYILNPGDGILVPPFTPHFAHSTLPVTMSVIHFDFFSVPERMIMKQIGANEYEGRVPEYIFRSERENVTDGKLQIYSFNAIERLEVREKVESIVRLKEVGTNIIGLKSAMLDLIDYLFRADNEGRSVTKNKVSSWPTVRRVIEYIERNYPNPELNNETIYYETGACKSYLSQIFKKSTGQSIHNYLLNVRISKSKELLSRGFSVTEVSEMVGFSNIHSFSRAFKNFTGRSPTEYYYTKR